MVKTVPSGLATDLAQTTTSTATLWQITRTDKVAFYFTDHDADIVFEGNTYLSAVGYTRTAIENQVGLSVDNLEAGGFFDSSAITDADLRAGRFDYAAVSVFLVNWRNLSSGAMQLRRGTFGEVIFSDTGMFKTEIRGLTQAYIQSVVELFQPECRATLGDYRCQIPLNPDIVVRNTAYAVGAFVRAPVALAGISDPAVIEATENALAAADFHNRIYVCTTAGTTNASAQPAYDETDGNLTTDGTAVFQAMESWTRSGVVASVIDGNRTFTITVSEPRSTPSAEAAENAAELAILTQMIAVAQANIATSTFTDAFGNVIKEVYTGPTSSPALPWFTDGVVIWETGANAGTSMEIKNWTSSSSTVELFLGMPLNIAVGDLFAIYPGCSKLLPACKSKFNNVLNMRAEPYVPGQDAMLQYGVAPNSI